MVFFILKTHRALHFRCRINKRTQQVARQRVVVAARVHIFEAVSLVIMTLSIHPLKQESFNLVRCIERVAFLLVQVGRKRLQRATNIRAVRCAAFVDHFAKHQHFTRSEIIRRRPVKSVPVNAEPQIALALRRKSAN